MMNNENFAKQILRNLFQRTRVIFSFEISRNEQTKAKEWTHKYANEWKLINENFNEFLQNNFSVIYIRSIEHKIEIFKKNFSIDPKSGKIQQPKYLHLQEIWIRHKFSQLIYARHINFRKIKRKFSSPCLPLKSIIN